MAKYTGVDCPVCNKRFSQADDIVVCPVCGAPHHRACYAGLGDCAYAADHMSGKEWRPEGGEEPEAADHEAPQPPDEGADTRLCPGCGAANPSQALFCQVCGHLMTARQSPSGGSGDYFPFGDPFGGVPKEEKIGNLPVSDIMYYVGPSSAYYLPRFHAFEKLGNKAFFSVSAFVFNFLYFFYRKMYLVGAVLFALFVVGMIPSFLFLREGGPDYIIFMWGLGPEVTVNQDALNFYAQIIEIVWWISLVLRTAVAFAATRIYYKKVLLEVGALAGSGKQSSADYDYHAELIAHGGVDKLSVVLLIAVVTVGLSLMSNLLIGTV